MTDVMSAWRSKKQALTTPSPGVRVCPGPYPRVCWVWLTVWRGLHWGSLASWVPSLAFGTWLPGPQRAYWPSRWLWRDWAESCLSDELSLVQLLSAFHRWMIHVSHLEWWVFPWWSSKVDEHLRVQFLYRRVKCGWIIVTQVPFGCKEALHSAGIQVYNSFCGEEREKRGIHITFLVI